MRGTTWNFLQSFPLGRGAPEAPAILGTDKPGFSVLGMVRIVSRTPSGLLLVGTVNRPRKRKRTSRENPGQIGTFPKNRQSPPPKKKLRTKKTTPARQKKAVNFSPDSPCEFGLEFLGCVCGFLHEIFIIM